MSVSRLRLLLSLIGILFVALTAWSLRYFSRYKSLVPLSQGYLQPGLGGIGLQASDVRVVGREGGQRRWQALARTVTFSRDRRVVDVEGISKATLFPGPARPQVSLSAGHAVYEAGFGTVGTLRLDTNVRAAVLTAQRPVLQTQALLWNALTGTLTSPGPAQVSVPRLTLSAGRATYETRLPDAATGTLHLTGTVHALVQTAHGQAALTCPGLTWSGQTNIAQSLGPVRAQIPGGLGTTTAADVSVDTRTGNLTGHGFRGTLRLSGE